MTTLARSPNTKQTGAYYTDACVAQFLTNWAIRSADETVLDPSFGGGVFLHAACQRINALNGSPTNSVYGVELDAAVRDDTAARLRTHIPDENLWHSDFFDVDPGNFDAVVGNPPFVRYQAFTGPSRERAIHRAAEIGVQLPRLASSWAAFVVHSTAMLRKNGRLAMVLPMEMWHASYALPVLKLLKDRFNSLQLITFKKRLFSDISQDTVLLLADGHGNPNTHLRWRELGSHTELDAITNNPSIPGSNPLNFDAIADGSRRLIEAFIPERAQDLYRELLNHPMVKTLDQLANIGIGYVSGNNKFFHLSKEQARERSIPDPYLTPAICKGKALIGLRFDRSDWKMAEQNRDAAYLLHITPSQSLRGLPEPLLHYIQHGEQLGVHKAYKCRIRDPWFCVPHVHKPDAFLTYMSGKYPNLVASSAPFVSPNNLHTLRLRNPSKTDARHIAMGWKTSLTRLSAELQGHAMGGGMLKLEPKEAGRVAVPMIPSFNSADFDHLDTLARQGKTLELNNAADELMRQDLGLSENDCNTLNAAAEQLMHRRYHGGRTS